MDASSVAAAATGMKSAQVQAQSSLAVLKNIMDSQEQIAGELISQLGELSVGAPPPSLIDIQV